MERFVKEKEIRMSVDVEKVENLIPIKSIDVGFEVSKEIKNFKNL